jgi:hypothetical protein
MAFSRTKGRPMRLAVSIAAAVPAAALVVACSSPGGATVAGMAARARSLPIMEGAAGLGSARAYRVVLMMPL